MRVYLAGHAGSRIVRPAAAYLIAKYLPAWFDVTILTYGTVEPVVPRVSVVSLGPVQESIDAWGPTLAVYLARVPDRYVIFALDDYLVTGFDTERYAILATRLFLTDQTTAARLCLSDQYPAYARYPLGHDVIVVRDSAYTVTTQYTIWRRLDLVELLAATTTPWNFELAGSRYFNARGWSVIGTTDRPAICYDVHSALSTRWKGIDVSALSDADYQALVLAGHLDPRTVIR